MIEKTNEYEEYLRWFRDLDKKKPETQKPQRIKRGNWDKFFNDYERGKRGA